MNLLYRILSSTLLFSTLAGSSVIAQESMQLGLGGAFLFPGGEYGGSTADFYQGKKYGLSAGPGFHIKSRFECVGLLWSAQIEYFVVKNQGEAAPGQGRIDISGKMFALKAGPEFSFDISSLAAAYCGGTIAINNIGGDISFQAAPGVPDESFIMNSASRLGFGATAGILVKLNPRATLDLGASYNFVNPFLKNWKSDDPTVRVSSYKSLNDAADPLYYGSDPNHFVAHARSVNAFVVSLTVLFAI